MIFVNKNNPRLLLNSALLSIVAIILSILYLLKLYHIAQKVMLFSIIIVVIFASYNATSAYIYTGMILPIFLSIIFDDKYITHIISLTSIFILMLFVYLKIFTVNAIIIPQYGIGLVNNIQVAFILISLSYLIAVYIKHAYKYMFYVQQKQYDTLKQTQEHLIKQAKLDLLNNIAKGIIHDFNNTLMIVNNYVDILQFEPLPEHVIDMIEQIKFAMNNAQNLSTQLLNLVKVNKPKYQQIDDVHKLIKNSSTIVLAGSNTSINYNLNFRGIIMGDPIQINQIIQNLILNAKQVMRNTGTITVTTNNRTLTKNNEYQLNPGEYLEIHIIDTGPGIPDEIKSNIFELFFTTRSDGSGIGLYVCKRIIKEHKGWIGFESRVNEGTDFIILLPAINKENSL